MNTPWKPFTPEQMAMRVARDLGRKKYVNLGIGLPNLVARFVDSAAGVVLHSENGVLGLGPPPKPGQENPNLIDAGKNLATVLPGACYFDQSQSFAMIRGGHVDAVVLGAFEVSAAGDLANWSTDDPNTPPAVGGAMDLAVGAKSVLVMMKHTSPTGSPKIVERCSLPLTAARVVSRVYTDLAVIEITPEGLSVLETAPGLSPEELQSRTGVALRWPESHGRSSTDSDSPRS